MPVAVLEGLDPTLAAPPLEVSPATPVLVSELFAVVADVPPLPPVAEVTSVVPELLVSVTASVAVDDVVAALLVVPVLVTSAPLADSDAGLSDEHAAAPTPTHSKEPVNSGLYTLSSYYGSGKAPSENYAVGSGSPCSSAKFCR